MIFENFDDFWWFLVTFGIPPRTKNLSKIERKAFFVVMLSTAKVFRAGAVRKILKNYTLGAFVIFC